MSTQRTLIAPLSALLVALLFVAAARLFAGTPRLKFSKPWARTAQCAHFVGKNLLTQPLDDLRHDGVAD